MYVIKLNRDGPGINQSETKTVMAQRLTNRLSKPTRIKQTMIITKPKNDYQSETKTVMVQGEYGEAQITKGKFWNVNGTMTNKLKQDPSWSFNHSSPNVYERPGCCVDTSKNDYLGNVLIVQRPEDTHRDGPGINQSETKTVMAQRLTNRLSKPTQIKQTMITTKTTRIEIM